jgi:hypothetical protein
MWPRKRPGPDPVLPEPVDVGAHDQGVQGDGREPPTLGVDEHDAALAIVDPQARDRALRRIELVLRIGSRDTISRSVVGPLLRVIVCPGVSAEAPAASHVSDPATATKALR